jgi:RimJ/RimL family protein N-acetyltransferase
VRFPEAVETERLVLRRLRRSDREAMKSIWSDDDVSRALRPGQPPDPEFALARLAQHVRHWDEHGFGLWLAELSDGGETAGWIGPSHPDGVAELSEAIEIGWTLRRPFRGRGLASEGAAAAVTAAFAHLATDEVISLIHRSNEPSVAIAKRLGMRHDRDVHHPKLGELRVYALSRTSWESRWAAGA